MKNRTMGIVAILLMIALGNYFFIISDGTTRSVEFFSIFAIGALSAILISLIFRRGNS